VLSRGDEGLVEGFGSGASAKLLSWLLLAWISPAAVAVVVAKVEVWPGRIRSRRRLSSMPRAERISRIAVVFGRTMNWSAITGMTTRSRMVVLLSMREVPRCLRSRRSNQIVKDKMSEGSKT